MCFPSLTIPKDCLVNWELILGSSAFPFKLLLFFGLHVLFILMIIYIVSYDTSLQFPKQVWASFCFEATSCTPLYHVFLNEDYVAFYHTIWIVPCFEALMQMVNHYLMNRSEPFPPKAMKIIRARNLPIRHFLKMHSNIFFGSIKYDWCFIPFTVFSTDLSRSAFLLSSVGLSDRSLQKLINSSALGIVCSCIIFPSSSSYNIFWLLLNVRFC